MVAYSFKTQFIEPIRAGRKCQTVRGERPRHARQGEALQLYTGMRTKHCRLIGTAICSSIQPIRIDLVRQEVVIGADAPLDTLSALDAFAAADGFEDFRGLMEFWRVNHATVNQWQGLLIRWSGFTLPKATSQ